MKKALLILLIAVGGYTAQAQQLNQVPMVSVTGEGTVKVVPDQVLIKSRIEHEGNDPQEVKKKNDAVVNNVIKYLKSQGIPENNVQTDYMNLNKSYNYNDKTYSYVANQSISILLKDLKDYEKIMSGLLDAGLNRIDGIEFKSSEIAKHKTEARKRAVLNAKQKAQEYVAPLNQTLGNALMISEIETNSFPPMFRGMESMKAQSDAVQEETIAPGEMEVNVKVNVGFELK